MVVIAKSKNVNSDFGGQLGRRGLVIFVINVISSALILLISSGGGGGVVVVGAQQNRQSPPPPPNLEQPQRGDPLGSISYDNEEFQSSMYEERDAINDLVKKWAPLVWLAPGEKFMPSSVPHFLNHVHPEKSRSPVKKKPHENGAEEDDSFEGDDEQLYLLQQHQEQLSEKLTAEFLKQRLRQQGANNRRNSEQAFDPNLNDWESRNKRTYKEKVIKVPFGENSENWNLVTDDDLESLLQKPNSFVFGESPTSTRPVPIYAMVSACPPVHADGDLPIRHPFPFLPSEPGPAVPPTNEYKPITYIPFASNDALSDHFGVGEQVPNLNPIRGNELELGQRRRREAVQVVMAESVPSYDVNLYNQNLSRAESSSNDEITETTEEALQTTTKLLPLPTNPPSPAQESGPVEWSVLVNNDSENPRPNNNDWTPHYAIFNPPSSPPQPPPVTEKIVFAKRKGFPHFHVTYWLFYPYNQGKTMCSISLGPLGRVPIPLIFGACLGTRKEFGSHIGDWEHMSLVFRGRAEPEEMYVSAHDAGAYYEFNRISNRFEFRKQETRVGILQKPEFPKSVYTSDRHPLLFAAHGSHGLWTAPGMHKFVRVPRLYDVNGYGTPWMTWRNTEIIYTDDIAKRSFTDHWIHFQGRWGNAKNKCLSLRGIELHFCEFSDGPKGIAKRAPHFQCPTPATIIDSAQA